LGKGGAAKAACGTQAAAKKAHAQCKDFEF
jgi:hypothetical protein